MNEEIGSLAESLSLFISSILGGEPGLYMSYPCQLDRCIRLPNTFSRLAEGARQIILVHMESFIHFYQALSGDQEYCREIDRHGWNEQKRPLPD